MFCSLLLLLADRGHG